MPQKADPTRGQPLSLASLRELGALDGFAPPEGAFDPNGAWKSTYQVWLVGANLGRSGYLSLERTPARDGKSVTLKVEELIAESAGAVQRTRAEIQCAPDPLATPASWRIEAALLDADGKTIGPASISETGVARAGTVEISWGAKKRSRQVAAPFTCNWSLFDAVQRLAGPAAAPLTFTLLDNLDQVKAGQRLSYREKQSIEADGKTLALQGFQQIGEGVLPIRYWLDEQHRLLFVVSGIRAYLFDADAQQGLEQRLQNRRRRRQ